MLHCQDIFVGIFREDLLQIGFLYLFLTGQLLRFVALWNLGIRQINVIIFYILDQSNLKEFGEYVLELLRFCLEFYSDFTLVLTHLN